MTTNAARVRRQLDNGHSRVPAAAPRQEVPTLLVLLLSIAVALGTLWAMALYERANGLRKQTRDGWRQIEVHLRRRHRLIPTLLDTVQAFMDFDSGTINRVAEACAKAATARPADAGRTEGELSEALDALFAFAGNDARWAANDTVEQLRQDLSSTDNAIVVAREFYNRLAVRYNSWQQTFPVNWIVPLFGFNRAELFEGRADCGRARPGANLSISK